jgi:catechol 2,3-dioxygenase-like lactoylglutathione lyase family enzyme
LICSDGFFRLREELFSHGVGIILSPSQTKNEGGFMRGFVLFVAGILVGLAVEAAVPQNQNPGIVGLNHVALSVPDLDKALTYYTKTMGFPEAFRSTDEKGQTTLVYVQISRNTFVELQPANPQRPPGINHFGIHVEKMGAAINMFKQRGANISESRVSPTKAILSNITDPNGVRIELAELPPESQHRQAMERWKQ